MDIENHEGKTPNGHLNNPNHFRDHKTRPTIGLLIDWLGGRYQSLVWPGVHDAAIEHGANLIIIAGGSLRSSYGYLDQNNVLYDLISSETIDGLVIVSGALSDYISKETFISSYTWRKIINLYF